MILCNLDTEVMHHLVTSLEIFYLCLPNLEIHSLNAHQSYQTVP